MSTVAESAVAPITVHAPFKMPNGLMSLILSNGFSDSSILPLFSESCHRFGLHQTYQFVSFGRVVARCTLIQTRYRSLVSSFAIMRARRLSCGNEICTRVPTPSSLANMMPSPMLMHIRATR